MVKTNKAKLPVTAGKKMDGKIWPRYYKIIKLLNY